MFSALQRAAVASNNSRSTRWGSSIAHSRARMPPIEPPITACQRKMPKRMASCRSAATRSRMVKAGKRGPQGRPSGAGLEGPLLPWQPPNTLGQSTKKRSVSRARPGPIRSSHQPGAPWPGPAGPAAWLSPLKPCSSSTALSAAPFSWPQLSQAMVRGPRRPPNSSSSGVSQKSWLN